MAFGSFNKKISGKPTVLTYPRKDIVFPSNLPPTLQPLT